MVIRLFLAALCLPTLIVSWDAAPRADPAAGMGGDPEERAIRIVLDRQTAAWNKGDLEGFMAGYLALLAFSQHRIGNIGLYGLLLWL